MERGGGFSSRFLADPAIVDAEHVQLLLAAVVDRPLDLLLVLLEEGLRDGVGEHDRVVPVASRSVCCRHVPEEDYRKVCGQEEGPGATLWRLAVVLEPNHGDRDRSVEGQGDGVEGAAPGLVPHTGLSVLFLSE